MAKRITTLSNKYKTRSNDRLDSDRYRFLDITQAEPNPGNPESDGALFFSQTDGTRGFTSQPTLSGLIFRANSLDSINTGGFILGLRNPFVNDSVGIINISDLLSQADSAPETLQTVTERGDSTSLAITVAGLRLTNISEDLLSTNVLVLTSADSVAYRSISSLDSDTLHSVTTRGDSTNNVLTLGGLLLPNLIEDSAAIRYLALDDSNIVVVKTLQAETLQTVTERGDSTNLAITVAGIRLTNILAGSSTNVLVLSDSDTIQVRPIEDLETDTLQTVTERGDSTNLEITTAGIRLTNLSSGTSTTILVLNDSDRVETRLFSDLVDSEADTLQTVTDRGDSTTVAITIGGLKINNLTSFSSTNVLVIDDSANVRLRDFSALLDSEQDTLQTVTERGNTTTEDITVAKLNADSTTVAGDLKFTGQLLDNNDRRLIIYDSTGAVLWGA